MLGKHKAGTVIVELVSVEEYGMSYLMDAVQLEDKSLHFSEQTLSKNLK